MPENNQQRQARLRRNGQREHKFTVNDVQFGDVRKRVDRMKKKESGWSLNRALFEGFKLFLAKYK